MTFSHKSPLKRWLLLGGGTLAGVLAVLTILIFTNPAFYNWFARHLNKKTVADRLTEHQAKVEGALGPIFIQKKIQFPPEHVTLLFIKDQKKMFLYAGPNENETQLIKTYDVLAASGKLGPKLKEGDNQVPEGIYTIESLNPNSLYHLALRVNYPNAYDLEKAESDGRDKIGKDIMIHGNKVSIGCIAIGDEAIEEIFVLAALTDYTNWRVVFAPTDFRYRTREENASVPMWITELDQKLLREFLVLPE